jgi:hypothetical protein
MEALGKSLSDNDFEGKYGAYSILGINLSILLCRYVPSPSMDGFQVYLPYNDIQYVADRPTARLGWLTKLSVLPLHPIRRAKNTSRW